MMLTTSEMTKRKQLFLSNKEKWEIAKWLIEGRIVVQDIHAYQEKGPAFIPFSLWRMKKTQSAIEAKEAFGADLSPHHLDSSISFYNEVCELTGSHPNVPAIQDTVEMDMLTAKNKRLETDLSEVTNEYQKLQTAYNAVMKNYGAYFSTLRKIAELIPADCFGKKAPQEPKVARS